jgi:hypothetical protein
MEFATILQRSRFAYAVGLLLLFQGCTHPNPGSNLRPDVSSASVVERKV